MIVATAVSAGVMLSRSPENISRGSVRWSGPATSSAMTTSSNDAANANSAPDAIAGTIDGRVTRKNATRGVAPHDAAARARLGSSSSSAVSTGTTTNGTAITVWARMRPVNVLVSESGARKK